MATVSPEQLLLRLAKGKPVPGILLLGAESYLREMCRKRIVDAFVAEAARDWGVSRFSAAEDSLPAILGQAQTLPMLAPQQVIIVGDVQAWERKGDEAREIMVKELAHYFNDPAPFSVLVFEANGLDQRTRMTKLLMEKTLAVGLELPDDPAARSRLAASVALEIAAELGISLEQRAAEELAEILNGNLSAIKTELQKLAAYAGESRRVTRADVELLVISARKYSVWELADMLASRRAPRALEFLDGLLRDGEEPVGMVGAMAWMYRKLLEAQELPASIQGGQAAGRLGMRPATAELAVRQSRKFPREQLTLGLAALYEADSRLKSGGASQRAVMEFLIAQLASPAAA